MEALWATILFSGFALEVIIRQKNDARLIAVGGDALSRGLTLEGLCVTYFFRNSVMYDSLLQMGRWFGYRGRDADIMKIWISDPILESFRYITQALSEFRQTLDTMIEKGKTPEQRVRKILWVTLR